MQTQTAEQPSPVSVAFMIDCVLESAVDLGTLDPIEAAGVLLYSVTADDAFPSGIAEPVNQLLKASGLSDRVESLLRGSATKNGRDCDPTDARGLLWTARALLLSLGQEGAFTLIEAAARLVTPDKDRSKDLDKLPLLERMNFEARVARERVLQREILVMLSNIQQSSN
ncbi:hypothetical protein E6Q11_01295 [Candidatus Dojkabacteria bacterium]|uniref:Uncharacterized protein n=1 Tax=Candidatus Dojkabacteria bacterium TaxID=2099670 RepID=A0A5C7JA08_9BACT|nr:MAG: hypothetical protein E6Q11_01295 [Candidatus Dojkabacteria bacterium]